MNRVYSWLLAGVIGLSLAGVTPADASIVFQDNFDSYSSGLWGNNGWYNSANMAIPWYEDNELYVTSPGYGGTGKAVLMNETDNSPQGFSASRTLPTSFSLLTVGGPKPTIEFDYFPVVQSGQWVAFEPWVAVGPAADFGNDVKNTVLAAMVTYANWPDWIAAGRLIDVNSYGYAQNTLGTATMTGNAWNHVTLTAERTGTSTMNWTVQINALTPYTLVGMAYDPAVGLEMLQIGTIGNYPTTASSLLDNLVLDDQAPVPEPETVWMIVAVLASLGVTFRRQLVGMLVKA